MGGVEKVVVAGNVGGFPAKGADRGDSFDGIEEVRAGVCQKLYETSNVAKTYYKGLFASKSNNLICRDVRR